MTIAIQYVDPDQLVTDFVELAQKNAKKFTGKYGTLIEKDDLLSLCYVALITSAKEWNNYCSRKEFDPTRMDWFAYYASRRMLGAIQDEARKKDITSRGGREWIKQSVDNTYDNMPTRYDRRKTVAIPEKTDFAETSNSQDEVMLNLMVDTAIAALENAPRAYAISLALQHQNIKNQHAVWASIRVLAANEILKSLVRITGAEIPSFTKLTKPQQTALGKVEMWEASSDNVDDDNFFVGNAYVDYFYDSLREEPTLIFEIVKLLNHYFKKS